MLYTKAIRILVKIYIMVAPYKKAIFWYWYNLIFGLAPLLIAWSLYFLVSTPELKNELKDEILFLFIKHYVVVFYSVAMMAAVCLDVVFSKYKYSYHTYFILGAVPFAILNIALINYVVVLMDKQSSFNITNLIWVQSILLVLSAVFCIFIKIDLIVKEKSQ